MKTLITKQQERVDYIFQPTVIDCNKVYPIHPEQLDEVKSLILQNAIEVMEKMKKILDEKTHRDHSQCLMKQTCVGYQEAMSDIEDILTNEIETLKQ
jgi:hypothetical protein